MDRLVPSTRDLAERLLALEAAGGLEVHGSSTGLRVCEKMRVSLTRFAGGEGFSALMRRALALARVEAPSLQAAQVTSGGSVVGLEEAPNEAMVALIANLLALLYTFIGEGLTLRLVRETWPEILSDK